MTQKQDQIEDIAKVARKVIFTMAMLPALITNIAVSALVEQAQADAARSKKEGK